MNKPIVVTKAELNARIRMQLIKQLQKDAKVCDMYIPLPGYDWIKGIIYNLFHDMVATHNALDRSKVLLCE